MVSLLCCQVLGGKMLQCSVSFVSLGSYLLGGGGLKLGLYQTFRLHGKPWAGSHCERRDLTVTKSNQMF